MSDPLLARGSVFFRKRVSSVRGVSMRLMIRNNPILFAAMIVAIMGLIGRIWNSQPVFYAHAYSDGSDSALEKSPILAMDDQIFPMSAKRDASAGSALQPSVLAQDKATQGPDRQLQDKIADMVGDSPMKEMVPFIASRDQMTAAFLVGIAKKESSFGLASPSKQGESCYNYWGLKGAGSRGQGMGYACFASAEEAVKAVGDRIEDLVKKNRTTPSSMVNTWKCGGSCAGDPGAPSWVSTVALYFDKIVSSKS